MASDDRSASLTVVVWQVLIEAVRERPFVKVSEYHARPVHALDVTVVRATAPDGGHGAVHRFGWEDPLARHGFALATVARVDVGS